MYKLELQRRKEYKNVKDLKGKVEDSTIGTLQLFDENEVSLFKGFTCENIGPSTDKPRQDKRIIARTYDLEWTTTTKNSNNTLGKWQNNAILLTCDKELPNFRNRRILIHTGNYPSDTEGCILVGEEQTNSGAVSKSVVAIIRLFNLIEKIGIDNIKLEVNEIKG